MKKDKKYYLKRGRQFGLNPLKDTKELIKQNNPQKKLRKTLLDWINKYDVNYRYREQGHHEEGYTVDIDDLLAQIEPFTKANLKNQEERLYKLEEIRCQEAVQKEREKMISEIKEIEKDALGIGLTEQGRQIIDRIIDTLNQ